MKKVISLLGSTGSIGQSTLQVLKLHPDSFQIFALSCFNNTHLLVKQCIEFQPKYLVTKDTADAKFVREQIKGKSSAKVLSGSDGYEFIAGNDEVTDVLAAITGSAGLKSTYQAAIKGKRILLANKESMVMAGSLIMAEVAKSRGSIIPVDSEHNAIYQVLINHTNKFIRKVILTASGGPFRDLNASEIENVTVEEALNHPNWSMGDKITIDSATMMNKGLEVIEASYLFNLPSKKIEVLVHPQSIIHSLVEYEDGSLLTQLGCPDMRVPISFALGYPDRIRSGVEGINLAQCENLSFSKPNHQIFPCLNLAYEALEAGQSHIITLNAANEIAVDAFLHKKIKFTQIYILVRKALDSIKSMDFNDIDSIISLDRNARKKAQQTLMDI
tara:strand:+ start:40072 stop:41232 length:1161 start_codon:yes stop_codon:yes gene_type:complete